MIMTDCYPSILLHNSDIQRNRKTVAYLLLAATTATGNSKQHANNNKQSHTTTSLIVLYLLEKHYLVVDVILQSRIAVTVLWADPGILVTSFIESDNNFTQKIFITYQHNCDCFCWHSTRGSGTGQRAKGWRNVELDRKYTTNMDAILGAFPR